GLAFRYLRPFALVEWVLFPFSILLQWIGMAIVNLSGGKLGSRYLVSEELLRSVISVGQREGAVDREEARMLHKVFSFGDRRVKEVMTPRTEMIWISEDTRLSDFLDTYDRAPRPRFPVYKEEVDNVVGILHTSDVIRAMHKGEIQQDSSLLHLVRPARFVPETKPLDDLFAEISSSGIQMVIVVDEYGGVAGLVTTTQLVGAITGWAGGEEEALEEEFESLGEGAFQVDAGIQVTEANERLGLSIPDGEYETVAGFVLDALGHIPREGETFRHRRTKLTVTEMAGVKIEKVLVTKL
ncbi:MAG: hemolysin family protein, partial [Dehalococcoidia bacterium]